MMTEFTPLQAIAGGALIGVSAVTLMALNGRIAGVSGMIAGALLPQSRPEAMERLAFLAGLVLAPLLYGAITGVSVQASFPDSLAVVAGAGLLVGFGTAYGNGCTSGHGVCGVARGSQRSITATAIFIATSMLTVFIVRHVLQ